MGIFTIRNSKLTKMKFLFSILFFLCFSTIIAQVSITGNVTEDKTGLGLPGANVLIKGTTTGTQTDMEGNFEIQASQGDVLIVSYIGYQDEEILITGTKKIQVFLKEDVSTLDELVVVGYGSQKKSVVTGSISRIKAEDLKSIPIRNVDESLQGRTTGVTVMSNSGQPGSNSTIRVRGTTSLQDGSNDPLWVVDGVVVDYGGMNYLNQSDIESIEVLKDAASQAIYGTRAAAGVILITTKKGSAGKMRVEYNGQFGTSAPAKKLELTNASEYATLQNEFYNDAIFENPSALGEGTDWQDVIFNESAKRQNHELSISGGNKVSTYYASFGYWDQEGIVATEISNYERVSARLNSEHKITEWLTIGQNFGYAHQKSIGIGNTNSEYGGPLSSAINLDPITPVVVTNPEDANLPIYSNEGIVRDENGNPYAISEYVGQEMANPKAYIQTRLGNYNWSDDFIGNVYVGIKIIEGLKFRTTLGSKLAFWGNESFTPVSYLNSSSIISTNSFNRGKNRRFDYNIENTLSYSKKISEHSFEVLLGQGAYKDNYSTNINVTKWDLPVDNFDDASLNYDVPTDQITAGGGESVYHTMSSLFARLNYNFGGKYLLTVIARRDGSSRFGENNKYGFFPSGSVGWIASEESFWPQNEIVNFLKVRGGYGVVGNDNIGNHAYLSTVGGGRNYAFGTEGQYYNGVSPNAPSNPDLRWEETTQINFGLESKLIKNIFFSFDWFKKITDDILMYPSIPGYVGAISNPAANVGSLENSGIELELGYDRTFNEFEFRASGNVTYLTNEVTFLGNGVDFLSGGNNFQASSYPITRTAVGQPINSFYGFHMLGIFQNEVDIFSHVNSAGDLIQPDAQPGDIIWDDLNDDGEITEDDRTFIGNPTPKWTYGLTLNAGYKNFDLLIFGQGAAGNMIFQGLRRLDITNANYQAQALDRWTVEGSTNEYPRIINGDPNHNFSYPSELYLEKGNYFRIKIIQLGYNLPGSILQKIKMQKIRVFVTAENLFTITKYSGFDPEIGGGTMSIDRGIYPQARSFLFGVNLGI